MKENQNQIDDSQRQPCEVWTRVMGYHRPVSSFNSGKKIRTPTTLLLQRRTHPLSSAFTGGRPDPLHHHRFSR